MRLFLRVLVVLAICLGLFLFWVWNRGIPDLGG
jgi:hypothetical protein